MKGKAMQPLRILKTMAIRTLPPSVTGRLKRHLERYSGNGPMLSLIAARLLPAWFEGRHRRRAFQTAYGRGQWGLEEGASFFSGIGSRGPVVDAYVGCITGLIEEHARELGRLPTVVDLGCGDFSVGRQLLGHMQGMNYVGCDIVPELIEAHTANVKEPRVSFRQLDIVTGDLPDGDICLVRQVLQHLSNSDIGGVLKKLAKYHAVYITEGYPVTLEGPPNPDKPSGPGVRWDWRTGRGRGTELDLPPFGLRVQEVCRVASNALEELATFRVWC
jgi:methyltransferase family protein